MNEITQSISEKANQLLNKEEGFDVDFKRDMKGLKPEDLVSFANSPLGGTILVGVDEYTDEHGQQRGKVYGCVISDREKLAILGKASECRPPVDVEIFVENEGTAKAFYRIEIPSGQYKPYCTNKGLYQIRGDGRNNPITPEKLLAMYLEVQGETFFDRFKEATQDLNNDLLQTKNQVDSLNSNLDEIRIKLNKDIQGIWADLEDFSRRVHGQLDDISHSADNASSNSDDAASESQDVNWKLDSLEKEVEEIAEIVNTLRKHFEIEHPYITKRKNTILKKAKEAYPQFKQNYLAKHGEKINTDSLFSDYKEALMRYFIDKQKVKLKATTIENLINQVLEELKSQ